MGAKVVKQLQEQYGEELYGLYKAVYLGTIVLDSPEIKPDSDPVAEVVALAGESQQIPRKVWVVVSSGAIRIMGRVTRDVLQTAPIPEIIFCGLARNNQKRFSYIAHDSTLGLTISNVFSVKDDAATLPRTVARAVMLFRQREGLGSPPSSPQPGSPTKSQTSDKTGTTSPTGSEKAIVSTPKLKKEKKRRSWPLLRKGNSANKLTVEDPDQPDGQILGSFQGKYLGSSNVDSITGQQTVNGALAELRSRLSELHGGKKAAKKLAGDSAILSVSSDGVRTRDTLTGEVLFNVFIKDVAYTSTVRADKKKIVFALIAKDDRLKTLTCYVLDIPKKGVEVCKLIASAMDTYAVEYKGNKAFTPVSLKEDVQLPPALEYAQLDRKCLKALKVLGSGQFGKVYLADQTIGGEAEVVQRAVKLLRGGASEENKALFLREMNVTAQLRHANIVCMVGIAVIRRPWLAVLEFMQYGDLRAAMKAAKEKNIRVNLQEHLTIIIQVCDALEYMAQNRFVHMDVALRNCLLHTNNVVKLADFGLTREYDEGKTYHLLRKAAKLPMKWLAPEGPTKKRFGEPTDMWAYGVTIWECFSYGKYPYEGVSNTEVQRLVRDGKRLERPEDCPEDLFKLWFQCFDEDPNKRPSFTSMSQSLKAYQKNAVVGNAMARDIGPLLNSELTADIRRMSVSARKSRQPTIKRKSVRRGKTVIEEVDDPRLPGDIIEAEEAKKKASDNVDGSLMNATQIVISDDLRVRLQSVSRHNPAFNAAPDDDIPEEPETSDAVGLGAFMEEVEEAPNQTEVTGARRRSSALDHNDARAKMMLMKERRMSQKKLLTEAEQQASVDEISEEPGETSAKDSVPDLPPPSPFEAFRSLRQSLSREVVVPGLENAQDTEGLSATDAEPAIEAEPQTPEDQTTDMQTLEDSSPAQGSSISTEPTVEVETVASFAADVPLDTEEQPQSEGVEEVSVIETGAKPANAETVEEAEAARIEKPEVPTEQHTSTDVQDEIPSEHLSQESPAEQTPTVNDVAQPPAPTAAKSEAKETRNVSLEPVIKKETVQHSKIFQALNPQRLYYDDEEEEDKKDKTTVVSSTVGIRNYSMFKNLEDDDLQEESNVDELRSYDDAYDKEDESDAEIEEEDFNMEDLPDFGELEEFFLAKRRERDEAEEKRQQELKERFVQQARETEAARAKELAEIAAIKAKEAEEAERRKLENFDEAMQRSEQLQFTFRWQ